MIRLDNPKTTGLTTLTGTVPAYDIVFGQGTSVVTYSDNFQIINTGKQLRLVLQDDNSDPPSTSSFRWVNTAGTTLFDAHAYNNGGSNIFPVMDYYGVGGHGTTIFSWSMIGRNNNRRRGYLNVFEWGSSLIWQYEGENGYKPHFIIDGYTTLNTSSVSANSSYPVWLKGPVVIEGSPTPRLYAYSNDGGNSLVFNRYPGQGSYIMTFCEEVDTGNVYFRGNASHFVFAGNQGDEYARNTFMSKYNDGALAASFRNLYSGTIPDLSMSGVADFRSDEQDRNRVALINTNLATSCRSSTLLFAGNDSAGYTGIENKFELGNDFYQDGNQTFYLWDSINGRLVYLYDPASPYSYNSFFGGSCAVRFQSDDASYSFISFFNTSSEGMLIGIRSGQAYLQAQAYGWDTRIEQPGGGLAMLSCVTFNCDSINVASMPTSDPADGKGTLWYDTMTNIVYRGT